MTRQRPRGQRAVTRVALAVVLVALALAAHTGRRQFIARFFARGPGGAEPPGLTGGGGGGGLAPVGRLRVVLLDGLGLERAADLPGLSALCRTGDDLRVDVGFPTVSLPVEAALWTGLTQQQTGIQFVGARLDPPLADSLPARAGDAVAIAESHAFIIESLGFAATRPRPDEVADPAAQARWQDGGFAAAARTAVAGPARLVFVHVLRIDDAGHKHGGDSRDYALAAGWADHLLTELVEAAPPGDDTRWLVLADHGHTAAGGHGGPEPDLRIVRACLVGGAVPPAPRGRLVHLVDLSRAVADSLGLAADVRSAGRPLAAAVAAAESPGATLPHPSLGRWLVAGALLVLALLATVVACGRRIWLVPLWLALSYASIVTSLGAPSLSSRMIYPPLGRTILVAGLPGLLLLAIIAGVATARSPVRLVVAQLALPITATLACLVLCWGQPPLMPRYTALASLQLALLSAAAMVLALALLAGLVRAWFDRGPPTETPRSRP